MNSQINTDLAPAAIGPYSQGMIFKTTCFLSNMENFAGFNEVYAEVFGAKNTPARSCVEVARLPKDALVEVEAMAYTNH